MRLSKKALHQASPKGQQEAEHALLFIKKASPDPKEMEEEKWELEEEEEEEEKQFEAKEDTEESSMLS